MNKQLIALTIGACLAGGTAWSQDEQPENLDPITIEGEQSDRPKARMRNLHGPQFKEDDTSQLRSEPCPDYFDTDWGLVNQPGDPCWNAYLTSVGEENVPRAVREKIAAAQPGEPATTAAEPTDATDPRLTRTTAGKGSPDSREAEDCEEENLAGQAVAERRYREELEQRESAEKAAISADFDPRNDTAKSVAQLRDDDIRQSHLDNTFAALDDDNSGAINRIEALDVRGLADEFDQADFNGDQVVSEAEFNLYFDGRLAGGEFICLDGERVTRLEQVPGNRMTMR